MMYRQPYFSLRIEHAAEIAPSNCKVRSCLDRLQVAGLEKQNTIYSVFIREVKGTRAARYARPPIAAPQLLSLSFTCSHFPSFFFSPFILSSLISKEQKHILPLYVQFCFLSSPYFSTISSNVEQFQCLFRAAQVS